MRKDFATVSSLLKKAVDLWPSFYETNKEHLKGKTGLYFFVQDQYGNSGGTVLGMISDKDLPTAMIFAIEKLARTLNGDPFNSTSFPTQNYAQKQYGGCIRTSVVRVTSSGLSPQYEHKFGMLVLEESGELGYIESKNIQAEFEKYKDTGKK